MATRPAQQVPKGRAKPERVADVKRRQILFSTIAIGYALSWSGDNTDFWKSGVGEGGFQGQAGGPALPFTPTKMSIAVPGAHTI